MGDNPRTGKGIKSKGLQIEKEGVTAKLGVYFNLDNLTNLRDVFKVELEIL